MINVRSSFKFQFPSFFLDQKNKKTENRKQKIVKQKKQKKKKLRFKIQIEMTLD